MTNKILARLAGATVILGMVAALAVSGVMGAGATPSRPPALPTGQHAFPVMGAGGHLLRDAHQRLVYYTPPNPAALRYLLPGRPFAVSHPAASAGPALARATHPTTAEIAALNAAAQAADAAAAASRR